MVSEYNSRQPLLMDYMSPNVCVLFCTRLLSYFASLLTTTACFLYPAQAAGNVYLLLILGSADQEETLTVLWCYLSFPSLQQQHQQDCFTVFGCGSVSVSSFKVSCLSSANLCWEFLTVFVVFKWAFISFLFGFFPQVFFQATLTARHQIPCYMCSSGSDASRSPAWWWKELQSYRLADWMERAVNVLT